jgi:hypothetical protein
LHVLTRGGRALVAVLPQWIVARLIVAAALGMGHFVVDRTHPDAATAARVHQGLSAWDAGWYETIARFGYAPLGHQALRFFPLYPLAGRALAQLPGVGAGAALVVLANLGALAAAALLGVLVRRETGDPALASLSVWLFCLAPSAYVLVMGYAEGLLFPLVIGCFLAIRRANPSWWLAAGLGYAAGLTRPLGALLVVPVAVEAARHWRAGPRTARLGALVATVAPLAGTGTFLAWSAGTQGDGWLPLRVQAQSAHHGGLSDPLRTLVDDARGALHHHVGTALHVPWVVLVVALVVVCWWRLPAAYGAFATAVVAVGLSGTNLDSFERYALTAFPLVIAGATLLGREWVRRSVLTLAAAGLGGYALLAFLGIVVP